MGLGGVRGQVTRHLVVRLCSRCRPEGREITMGTAAGVDEAVVASAVGPVALLCPFQVQNALAV